MDHKTLKLLRLFAPILMFAALCWPISQYFPNLSITLIETPIFKASIAALAFGVFYNMTPARHISNYIYFDRVGKNISEKMWIYGKPQQPKPNDWNWSKARRIFFSLVDKDPSLSTKTANVYFNGFLWTTAADLRAVSSICWITLILCRILVGPKEGEQWWIFGLPLLVIISFYLSETTTRKQISLGNAQLEHIAINSQAELSSGIDRAIALP